jgi:hypothetical protein
MADPLQRPLDKELPVLVWALEELSPQLAQGGAQVGRSAGSGGGVAGRARGAPAPAPRCALGEEIHIAGAGR